MIIESIFEYVLGPYYAQSLYFFMCVMSFMQGGPNNMVECFIIPFSSMYNSRGKNLEKKKNTIQFLLGNVALGIIDI